MRTPPIRSSSDRHFFPLTCTTMTTNEPSSASKSNAEGRQLVAVISERHKITPNQAAQLVLKYTRRAEKQRFCDGWWLQLLDAQHLTHIGPRKRIRCGHETRLRHLIPEATGLCHDCGCARGEYHVFGCDAEECSHCGGQAFCCDCDDGTEKRP